MFEMHQRSEISFIINSSVVLEVKIEGYSSPLGYMYELTHIFPLYLSDARHKSLGQGSK